MTHTTTSDMYLVLFRKLEGLDDDEVESQPAAPVAPKTPAAPVKRGPGRPRKNKLDEEGGSNIRPKTESGAEVCSNCMMNYFIMKDLCASYCVIVLY